MSGDGWVYFPKSAPGLLGASVVWASAADCDSVNLIVDEGAEALAFAATGFGEPAPKVWSVQERDLIAAVATAPTIEPAPACAEMTAVLSSAGLDVVADHGVWLGELNGLEVARVGSRDGTCSIDIGVGAYDQFASAALTPEDKDPAGSLASVVSMVRPHRSADSAPHAIGRLVRARWLRAQLVLSPELVGLTALDPTPLLIERPGLMESQPAGAIGVDEAGDKVLVCCAVGLDLGIAETAAGLVALHKPDRVVVAVPPRDEHPRIVAAVSELAVPSVVVAVEGEWAP